MHKRIVIKVGTKVLSKNGGMLDTRILAHLVEEIVRLRRAKHEVVLVTSGAVGAGKSLLKSGGTEGVEDKQVYAAVGQVKLMETYAKLFRKHGYLCAQVLATKEDFRDRAHYRHMRNCFLKLLRDGIVPVVNENDVVAIKELIFTDNDELTGLVARLVHADLVIILTSVDGLLSGDPASARSERVQRVTSGSAARYRKLVRTAMSTGGRGGMVSKFAVAHDLMMRGITVVLANGKKRNMIRDILAGRDRGTTFAPRLNSAR